MSPEDFDGMRKKIYLTILRGILFSTGITNAQDIALKTRLTKAAVLSLDAGVEIGLAPKWTADFSLTYNPWTLKDNSKWKILMFEPQLRYWPCQKFFGWFLTLYSHGGAFNIGNVPLPKLRDMRYEGWFIGGGLGGGYQFILSRHFSLEMELGAGFDYSRYDSFLCSVCGKKLEEDRPNKYWGLNKANISLVYYF